MRDDQRKKSDRTESESIREPENLRRRILRIVMLNTGGPQPITISEESLQTLFTYANFDDYAARKVLSELVDDGAIVEEDGRYRLGPR